LDGVLERFSDEARRAVRLAGEEARLLGHGHVGTEHLLLGLAADQGSAASDALNSVGASLALCREKVVEALASRPASPQAAGKDLPFSDRASRALERASKLSVRMDSESVGSQHVLLSVLDVEGTAGQVLRGLGVDPSTVKRVLAASAVAAPPASPPDMPETEPTTREPRAIPCCGMCGSSLDTSLQHTVLTIGSGDSPTTVDVLYCAACGTALGASPAATPR
jgi:ATP-dependent Clp protease ATP-binding subunit ClpA